MTESLTKKEKGFVKDYIDTGNGTESALNNYDIESNNPINVAAVIASQNLRKLKIREAIESHAEPAESMIFKLSQEAEAEAVRLSASKDILDRAGFRPIEESKSVNINIDIEQTQEIKELTNRLNEIYRSTSITSNGESTDIVDTETQDKE